MPPRPIILRSKNSDANIDQDMARSGDGAKDATPVFHRGAQSSSIITASGSFVSQSREGVASDRKPWDLGHLADENPSDERAIGREEPLTTLGLSAGGPPDRNLPHTQIIHAQA